MSGSVEAVPPATIRNRSAEARRVAKASRVKPIVDLLNRGVSTAAMPAREGLAVQRGRPEMAPHRLERIDSAPGNGMAPETSDSQDMGLAGVAVVIPRNSRNRHREDLRVSARGDATIQSPASVLHPVDRSASLAMRAFTRRARLGAAAASRPETRKWRARD